MPADPKHLRSRISAVAGIVLLAMAVGFQFSLTLEVAGAPLRIVASDFLFVPAFALLGAAWLQGGGRWPGSRLRYLPLWLVALTVWFMVSIVNGRLATGEWIVWAVLHRGLGWIAIMGYLALGLLVGTLATQAQLCRFVLVFVIVVCGASIYSWLSIFAWVLGYTDLFGIAANWTADGFMGNRNAFGILAAASVAMLAGYLAKDDERSLGMLWPCLLLGIALYGIYASQSRTTWLAVATSLAALALFARFPWRPIVAAFVIALTISGTTKFVQNNIRSGTAWVSQIVPSSEETRDRRQYRPIYEAQFSPADRSIGHRIELTKRAFELWMTHPIVGIGLGVFYHQQVRSLGWEWGSTIHTTLLWLLVETGLVGAILFAAFTLLVLRALVRGDLAPTGKLEFAVFLALIAIFAASIATEIMFQRYLWFLMGLGLAIPAVQEAHSARSGDSARAIG